MKSTFNTRKLLAMAFLGLMPGLYAQAQAPQKFNYQGIARDLKGNPIGKQQLGLKISVLPTEDATQPEYEETQLVSTNEFGLYTLQIGNGTPLTGKMETVKWETGNKYIRVAIDPAGGQNYTDAGTTQLLSVPYAIYADKAGIAKQTVDGTSSHGGTRASNNYIEKTSATGVANSNSLLYDNGTNIGLNTTSPAASFHVYKNSAVVQEHLRMQNASTTGAGRFTMYNDGASAYATFTKYGSAYAGGYTGVTTLYPYANLLAFGNNGLASGDGLGRFLISTAGNAGISLFKNGTSKLKFHADFTSENVGIGGNSAPVARVHLNNTDGTTMNTLLTNNTTGHTATDGLEIKNTGNAASIINRENDILAFGTNNLERARIDANGNVGINTTAPTSKLEVDGTTSNTLGTVSVYSNSMSANNAVIVKSNNSGTPSGTFNFSSAYLGSYITHPVLGYQDVGSVGVIDSSAFGYGGIFRTSSLGTPKFVALSGTGSAPVATFMGGNIGVNTVSPSVTMDVQGTAFSGTTTDGIVNIGGDASTTHLTIDDNEIQAKNGSAGFNTLYLNYFGGSIDMANNFFNPSSEVGIGNFPGGSGYKLAVQPSIANNQGGVKVFDAGDNYSLYAEKSGLFEGIYLSKTNTVTGTPTLTVNSSSPYANAVNVVSQGTGITAYGAQGYGINATSDTTCAGFFTSSGDGSALFNGIVRGEYNGSSLNDYPGVYGKSYPGTTFWGVGVKGEGGYRGVLGTSNVSGGGNVGVYGEAYSNNGAGTTIGVYGYGSGGTTNWAGYFSGNHMITGTKNSAFLNQNGVPVLVNCVETPGIWFEDLGSGTIQNGEVYIEFPVDLRPGVVIDAAHPYIVNVTPTGNMGNYWVEKLSDGFKVHAPNAANGTSFDWRLSAKRKGYEDYRLEYAGASVAEDPFIKNPYSNKPNRDYNFQKDLAEYKATMAAKEAQPKAQMDAKAEAWSPAKYEEAKAKDQARSHAQPKTGMNQEELSEKSKAEQLNPKIKLSPLPQPAKARGTN